MLKYDKDREATDNRPAVLQRDLIMKCLTVAARILSCLDRVFHIKIVRTKYKLRRGVIQAFVSKDHSPSPRPEGA